jgi:acetyl-CoA carboxylase biotin carboxyl carrier protein
VDIKDIKAIIDLMKKNSVSEFELEKQDFKIRLKRGIGANPTLASQEEQSALAYATSMISAPSQLALPSATAPTVPASTGEVDIKSPMIGTFYRSPSPESGSYVEVGSEVNPDTVVCIVEAMKVMNEIKAEVKGVITQVLMENAKPVEFGQPLYKVRPS